MYKSFLLILFPFFLFSCTTQNAATKSDGQHPISSDAIDPNYQLDERYEDNGSKNGNHTIVYFSGNLKTKEEIKDPLLRGFEQAHIIAKPTDNLIILFIDESLGMTMYFTERDYYLDFIDGDIPENDFIEYVSTKYVIQ